MRWDSGAESCTRARGAGPGTLGTGIVMGAYRWGAVTGPLPCHDREDCTEGFRWVAWRRRCMRLTG